MNNYELLADYIENSAYTVFLGGAGVSTESGIPDFRSADGIYSEKYGELSPEEIVSASFYKKDPGMFFDFYKNKMLYPKAKPNDAHRVLAELERFGMLGAVITQNIDGLHTAAGSVNVLELHGSSLRNYCELCGERYGLDFVTASVGVPRCFCGGIVRPEVTLYEEALPEGIFEKAVNNVMKSELLIVAGTSLAVYPAASLVRYAEKDCKIVLLNLSATPADYMAELIIREPVGKVLGKTLEIIKWRKAGGKT